MSLSKYLRHYLKHRPAFLSLIRSREAEIYATYLPLKSPSLDVGCGDGFFAKLVFDKMTYGLDIADSRIDQAAALGVYDQLLTYDGKLIPLDTASIGTAISNCVLEHVEHLPIVLKETHRVLKPRGKFLITVMAKPWEEHLVGAMFMGHSYRNWLRKTQVHVNLLSAENWRRQFEQAGFTVKKEIGYLSPTACHLIELFHYLSLPSLLTYTLFKTWNLLQSTFWDQAWIRKILKQPVSVGRSGALFYELQKL